MRRIWKRLLRLFGQSRIRLPRRALTPEDLREEDRLQIGKDVFRVRGSLLLVSGSMAFALEDLKGGPARGPVRLVCPAEAGEWVMVLGGRRVELPRDCLVRYPAEISRT